MAATDRSKSTIRRWIRMLLALTMCLTAVALLVPHTGYPSFFVWSWSLVAVLLLLIIILCVVEMIFTRLRMESEWEAAQSEGFREYRRDVRRSDKSDEGS